MSRSAKTVRGSPRRTSSSIDPTGMSVMTNIRFSSPVPPGLGDPGWAGTGPVRGGLGRVGVRRAAKRGLRATEGSLSCGAAVDCRRAGSDGRFGELGVDDGTWPVRALLISSATTATYLALAYP